MATIVECDGCGSRDKDVAPMEFRVAGRPEGISPAERYNAGWKRDLCRLCRKRITDPAKWPRGA